MVEELLKVGQTPVAAANAASLMFSEPLQLPCGAVIKNRLAKAAMSEGLADPMNRATLRHDILYRRWRQNDLGLLVSGNIQVDRHHLERAGNIAIEGDSGLAELREFVQAGMADGCHFWAQINHPGRQTPSSINAEPLAPSSISLGMAEAGCGRAQAMTEAQVEAAIGQFVRAASVCKQVGFTGVQIHAAHGYLISQFLSQLSNVRTDRWGGSLENRARFLLETVRQIRAEVGRAYPISVKLNSADFQRGGFTESESAQVAQWLDQAGVDLLEISGGNYEQMQMVGLGDDIEQGRHGKAESTVAREAYFLSYAERIRPMFKGPVMITGGMRTARVMQDVLQSGACDLIGIGRPMCVDPNAAAGQLLNGDAEALPSPETRLYLKRDALGPDIDATTFRRVESFGLLGWYCNQLTRLGRGEEAALDMDVYDALIEYKQGEEQAVANWCRPT